MKKTAIALTVTLLALTAALGAQSQFPSEPPQAGPPRDFSVPEAKRFTLANGLVGRPSLVVETDAARAIYAGREYGDDHVLRCLPAGLPQMRWRQLPGLWLRPRTGKARIWHARRNVEMAPGIVLRALGAPLKLVFTSAAQRR